MDEGCCRIFLLSLIFSVKQILNKRKVSEALCVTFIIKLCFDNPEMYYISLICDCAFEFFNLIFLFLSSVSAAEKEQNQLKGN